MKRSFLQITLLALGFCALLNQNLYSQNKIITTDFNHSEITGEIGESDGLIIFSGPNGETHQYMINDEPEEVRIIIEYDFEPVSVQAKAYSERGIDRNQYVEEYRIQNEQNILNLHQRLRNDLNNIQGKIKPNSDTPIMEFTITHEYIFAFAGAAVTTSSEALSYIRSFDYVKKIHEDIEVKPLIDNAAQMVKADSLRKQYGLDGDGIKIGVFDTGIDYTHPDLGGGNYGEGFKVIGGRDYTNSPNGFRDVHGHGTSVAGIIAADGQMQGIAPKASIFSYKVLSDSGIGWSSSIIQAVEHAITDGMHIINLSLGGDGDANSANSKALDNAMAAGVVAVVSAGNNGESGTISAPGASREAITVGAVNRWKNIAPFSSRGPERSQILIKPELVAPGVGINATRAGGGYNNISGTSASAPVVAGVAALLLQNNPDQTPIEIKNKLMQSAEDLGRDIFEQGFGLINALEAVQTNATLNPSVHSIGRIKEEINNVPIVKEVEITNNSSGNRTYTVTNSSLPQGVNVQYPGNITVDENSTKLFEVEFLIDYDQYEFHSTVSEADVVFIEFQSSDVTLKFGISMTKVRQSEFTFEYPNYVSMTAYNWKENKWEDWTWPAISNYNSLLVDVNGEEYTIIIEYWDFDNGRIIEGIHANKTVLDHGEYDARFSNLKNEVNVTAELKDGTTKTLTPRFIDIENSDGINRSSFALHSSSIMFDDLTVNWKLDFLYEHDVIESEEYHYYEVPITFFGISSDKNYHFESNNFTERKYYVEPSLEYAKMALANSLLIDRTNHMSYGYQCLNTPLNNDSFIFRKFVAPSDGKHRFRNYFRIVGLNDNNQNCENLNIRENIYATVGPVQRYSDGTVKHFPFYIGRPLSESIYTTSDNEQDKLEKVVPHPSTVFHSRDTNWDGTKGGFFIRGFFHNPWKSLINTDVDFEIVMNNNVVNKFSRENIDIANPDWQNSHPIRQKGDVFRAIFDGFQIEETKGKATYSFTHGDSFHPISLNQLKVQQNDVYQTKISEGETAEIYLEMLTWFQTNYSTGISNEGQISVEIAPSGTSLFQSLSLPTVTGLGTYTGKIGPKVTAIIPADLEADYYDLKITVTDDWNNRMDYVVRPAFVYGDPLPSVPIAYQEGWNLMGIPVETSFTNYVDVIPPSSQIPFKFSKGYELTEEVLPGTGYWIYMDNEYVIRFRGTEIAETELHLNKGWNLISGLSQDVVVENISDPNSVIDSDWFGFDTSYISVATIEPGRGYWIYAKDEGTIELNSQQDKIQSKAPIAVKARSDIWDSFNKISIISELDTLQVLYFGKKLPEQFSEEQFKMPPFPPDGIFDARFTNSESYLTTNQNPIISLQSVKEDLSFQFQNSEKHFDMQWEVYQIADGNIVNKQLITNGDKLQIYSEQVDQLQIVSLENEQLSIIEEPLNFSLDQNYPNPFNPTTNIRFTLPEQSIVTINVYNIAGQRVHKILDQSMQPGRHNVTFDGSSLTSGVYFYELQAGQYREVRKLTIIK